MTTISKNERLLNLVSFLLKARTPVSFQKIREQVIGYSETNVSLTSIERRFERDKVTLREMGVLLEFTADEAAGGPGYYIPRDAYFLPRIELMPSEAAILAAVSRFSMAGAAGPASEALQSALRKLQFDSPIPGEIRETAEEQFLFNCQNPVADKREQNKLSELAAAVFNGRSVKFHYYAIGHDCVERRCVDPYGLGFANGHWYMVGYDKERKGIRVFRVDRIKNEVTRLHPDATRPEFKVPDDFRIQNHIGLPPWLFGDAKAVKVRMKFDSDVAFMVQLRSVPGDKWEQHSDGSATVTRVATNLDALVNWALGFGHRVQILEPPEFCERIRRTLSEIAALHQGSPDSESKP